MRTLYAIITVMFVLVLASCEKKEIPEPDVMPPFKTDPTLWVSGVFDGVPMFVPVDGIDVTGDSFLDVQLFNPTHPPCWKFQMNNPNSFNFSFLAISIHNHDWQLSSDPYADLVITTSVNQLPFVDTIGSSVLNAIEIEYFSPFGGFETSTATNVPISVTESKDTLVGNDLFRIIGLEGDLTMPSFTHEDTLQVRDFRARIALSIL